MKVMIISHGEVGCYAQLDDDRMSTFFYWLEDDDVPGRRRIFLKIRDHQGEEAGCSCWVEPFRLNLDREAEGLYSVNWIENPNQEWSRRRGLARAALPLAVLLLQVDLRSDPRRRSGKAHDVHLGLFDLGLAERVGEGFTYRYEHIRATNLSAMHVLTLDAGG